MVHVMTDTETWGKRPGCAIRSIGAVVFGPHNGLLGATFYVNITDQSCLDVGLHHDPETVKWWEDQGEEAKAAFKDDQVPLPEALKMFTNFFRTVGGRVHWAHGPDFDLVIMAEAYRVCGMEPPWKFWDGHSTRTLYMVAGVRPDRSKGVHHHALNDAIVQAEAVIRGYQALGKSLNLLPADQA